MVLGALDCQVVFTTFDTSSFMVAIILCMSIVLALRWATSFLDWFFDFHYCVEKRCNIVDGYCCYYLADGYLRRILPVFGIVNTPD